MIGIVIDDWVDIIKDSAKKCKFLPAWVLVGKQYNWVERLYVIKSL